MCGIAGFVGNQGKKLVSDMICMINHRGPDNSGVYCNGCVSFAQEIC